MSAQRHFELYVTVEQELIGTPPRPFLPSERPRQPIWGYLVLDFAPDLCSLAYRLSVFCDCDPVFSNEFVTQAHLHAGALGTNGPILLTLFHGQELTQTGIPVNGLLVESCATDQDVKSVASPAGFTFSTIASIHQGIVAGQVYANVHGSSADPAQPNFSAGLIRGQVLASASSAGGCIPIATTTLQQAPPSFY